MTESVFSGADDDDSGSDDDGNDDDGNVDDNDIRSVVQFQWK